MYGGLGHVKEDPVHTIVAEARPKVRLIQYIYDCPIMCIILIQTYRLVLSVKNSMPAEVEDIYNYSYLHTPLNALSKEDSKVWHY